MANEAEGKGLVKKFLVLFCLRLRAMFLASGLVLSAAHQHGMTQGGLMGSHMFWIGVLFALTFAYILPAWLTGLLFVIALFASNVLPSVAHHAHSSTVAYLIVGVIALVVGLYFGRVRGLRHLGEAEFRTRWRNVRGVSRWI
jgi:hypothetical protein